jgi:phosphoglycolate phosphatase
MSRICGMLFDLDGTLLDSAPDLVASLNAVRRSEGKDPLPLSEMSRFASKGAAGLLRAGMPAVDDTTLEEWRQRFLHHYAQNSYENSRLYDGVPELLDALDRNGIPWGIVTNKFEVLTHPILEAAGLSDRASCVVCGDTLSSKKPDPAPVLLACETIGTEPGHTVFAGDDLRDIEAGKAAGTQTAAIHYGYGSHELTGPPVEGSYPIHRPADLVGLLHRVD